MVWKAYNVLYYNGKPSGRKFVAATGKTKEEVMKNIRGYNAAWNRLEKKRGVQARVVEIKQVVRKKRPVKQLWYI